MQWPTEECVTISYRCRDIGYGVEEGTANGVWGARDWTGKREFRVNGGPTLYLFDDEVVPVRPWFHLTD